MFAALIMLAADPARIPAPPVKPATYTIVGAMPAGATQVIAHAMHDAPPLPCRPIFTVEPMDYDGLTYSASLDLTCKVVFNPSIFRADNLPGAKSDHWWYADETVRHEIAHVLTPGEAATHGPAWRAYLNYLLRPLGLHETMDPDNGATVRMWHNGQCIAGCPVVSTTTVASKVTPTVLEAATAMVGTTPSYEAGGFWCWKFVEDIEAKAGLTYTQDSPGALWRDSFRVAFQDAQPGDMVFIDESPAVDHGYVGHVAIVETITPDGVNVIQGNGDDASTHQVARGYWSNTNIVGYGR